MIDYIIANHGEVDHSGALAALMREIPDTSIYCTANGVKSMKGQYHQDWNFVTVKTGDTLDLGESKQYLRGTYASLAGYNVLLFTGENILFSNDGFGQHYAQNLFNDTVDQVELYVEALKYYANILTPFSGFVTRR